jgi:hypothetical protein
MANSGGADKRRVWAARFERYHASGLPVRGFCKQERISPNTFYYWAKRLRTATAPSWAVRAMSRRPAAAKLTADSRTREAVVRFRWKSGIEVVVPADCLETIRCLAECLAEAGGRGEAFQEVVVKA